MTSVCLSITLVDFDHMGVQQKVAVATRQIGRGVLATCVPTPARIVVSCDPEFYRVRPVRYETDVVIVSASNGSHVELSQHLLSFLLQLEPFL